VIHVAWMACILWIAAATGAILLLQGSVDWLFDLPWSTRLCLAIVDIALLGWLVFQFGIRPWRKRLTLEQAALRAETRWPGLRTSLISAVQLARSPEGSGRMVEALIQQVAQRTAKMNFKTAVEAGHLKKLALLAAVLLLAAGGLGWWLAPKSMILLRRLLLSREPLPTQTIVVPVSGDFAIQAGQTIELVAKAQGVIPRAGRVEISYEGKGVQTVGVSPKPADPDTFLLTLPNVQQPLTYRFYLNDGRGPEFNVVLVHGPVLQSVTFEQNYPAYTGLAKTQHSAGNLTLLAGSKLHIEGASDQPLSGAHLHLKGLEQDVDLKVGGDGKSISGDLQVPAKGLEGFSIILKNTDGIQSQDNALYKVEVTPDKPPEITFATDQPDEGTLVTSMHPRLRFEVHDDFLVKQVTLCCEVTNDDPTKETSDTDPSKVKRIPIDVPKPAGALQFNYEWKDPDPAIWKEGTTINYWIEAVDNNDVTGPGVGQTPKRQWKIISLEEKRKEIADKLRKNAEAIEDISKSQDDLRNNVGDLLKKEYKK
jgi:hypothetical protein